MLRIEVTYSGLIKQEIGRCTEARELPDGATLGDLVHSLESEHGEGVRELLLDEHQHLLSSALVAVNGEPVHDLNAPVATEGGVVRILVMSPMMIGG